MDKKILLSHGSGGKETNKLIADIFVKNFDNQYLNQMNDSTMINIATNKIAITTDSFVVTPRFFKGGDIGKLAVCGTVNDLAVSGATPKYITCALIIEEGFSICELERIIKSMANEAKSAGVLIVAGDTKVVERGSVDGIFINTTGIGEYSEFIMDASKASKGDAIIVNGNLGDHGMSIMCNRGEINIFGDIASDCATLNYLVEDILKAGGSAVSVIRDATRGGVAAVLNEIANASSITIEIEEKNIPVKNEVRACCELLGLEPISIANEGKLAVFVKEEKAEEVLKAMRNNELGKDSKIIGHVVNNDKALVLLKTGLGGRRVLDMPSGEQLPRIC